MTASRALGGLNFHLLVKICASMIAKLELEKGE
jgi:hypothetical protein